MPVTNIYENEKCFWSDNQQIIKLEKIVKRTQDSQNAYSLLGCKEPPMYKLYLEDMDNRIHIEKIKMNTNFDKLIKNIRIYLIHHI